MVIWRIGNGESVNIWTDPWIPHGKTRRPATYIEAAVLTRVVDLLDPVSGSWDETLVKDTFSEFDAEAILKLRVNPDMEDRHAWHFDKKGLFSVKSAYKLAVQRRENEMGRNAARSESLPVGNSGFRWDKIWGMEVPNKVKMFILRLVHNSLAVRRNLLRRGVKVDTLCPMCQRLDEDPGHLFFKCKGVKECWRRLNLEEYRIILAVCHSGKDMMQTIWSLPSQIQLQIIVLLWRWWSARNKANAGDKRPTGPEVCSLVTFYVCEFEKGRKSDNIFQQVKQQRWEPPPEDVYKINTDGAFRAVTNQGGWGFVVRNRVGDFLEGGCGNLRRVASSFQVEALAVLHSVVRVSQLGISRIILETDASDLVRGLTSTDLDQSVDGSLLKQGFH